MKSPILDEYDTKKFLIRNEPGTDLVFPKTYRLEGKSVSEYIVIGETDDNLVLVPNNTQMLVSKSQLYSDKKDAQYCLFVKRVQEGTPVKNFKTSKYYQYYIERAKDENPELLFN